MSDDRPAAADADHHWVEAERLLSGEPDEATRSRLRRGRRRRLLAVLGGILAGGLLVGVVVSLLGDGDGGSAPEVPLWQSIAGFALMTAGCVVSLVATVRLLRGNRRRRDRGLPLSALTAGQRRELLAQVRGKAPVDPVRTGLARRLAEELVQQRYAIRNLVGLAALWMGQTVALPSWWRGAVAVAFVLLTVVTGVLIRRDHRSAEAYLAAHPG